ncbi:MAG: hypothetical protein NWF06_03040 [Candidatus Bathyarchaeota archaeon]|nr:hypothetical protein [Candidatus Bathyarchaeum sp.]
MITGIPGSNYIFIILLTIQTSFSFLIYEGRRWNVFVQNTLFTLLIVPTSFGGPSFNALAKLNFIIAPFFCDIIFNSFYGAFKKRNKLLWWALISTVGFWVLTPFIGTLLIKPLTYPPEYVAKLIEVILLLLPLIIIESIAGGYLGHKIYVRIKKDALINCS